MQLYAFRQLFIHTFGQTPIVKLKKKINPEPFFTWPLKLGTLIEVSVISS